MVHDDRIHDFGPSFDPHVPTDHRPDDASLRPRRSRPRDCCPRSTGQHARARAIVGLGVERPQPVVEIEARLFSEQVHVRGPVSRQRSDVPPVPDFLVRLDSGHTVSMEIVRVHPVVRILHHAGNDRRSEIRFQSFLRDFPQNVDKRAGLEHVVAHRGVRVPFPVRHLGRDVGLLQPARDPIVGSGLRDTEFGRFPEGTGSIAMLRSASFFPVEPAPCD